VTIAPIGAITNAIATPATRGITSAPAGGSGGFGASLAKGLDNLQATQTTADQLSVQAATGQLTDVQDYMIASTEASLATQLTVAIRDRAVEAFNEIMRMPVCWRSTSHGRAGAPRRRSRDTPPGNVRSSASPRSRS
jgi:flagellar hook-basal body complex protein FliE